MNQSAVLFICRRALAACGVLSLILFMTSPAASNHDKLDASWCRESSKNHCLDKARHQPREIVVVFGIVSCHYCHDFVQYTLADPEVHKRLRGYSLVYVDVEANNSTAAEFGIKLVPTTFVLTNTGQRLGHLEKSEPPKVFLAFLDRVSRQEKSSAEADDSIPTAPASR